MSSRGDRLLLLGWDAADWARLRPLMNAGRMPALLGLVERGISGPLMGVEPLVPVIGWTSLATGALPARHGIWGPVVPDETLPGEVREVGPRDRRTGALWTLASAAGLRAHAVGWPATSPAEAITGVCVSRGFLRPGPVAHEPVAREPVGRAAAGNGEVAPPDRLPDLERLRIEPKDVPPAAVAEILKGAPGPVTGAPGPAAPDLRAGLVAAILAEAWNTQAVAEQLLRQGDWDLACIFQPGIAQAARLFPDAPAVVDEIAAHQDALLEGLLQAAGDEVTIVLASAHGFRSRPGAEPPRTLEELEAWHRREGILVAAGPRIRRDDLIEGAQVTDLAPTLLAALGVPLPRQMDGRVLQQLFTEPVAVTFSQDPQPPAPAEPAPQESQLGSLEAQPGSPEALRQRAEAYLIELGYPLPREESERELAENVEGQNRFNLARSLLHVGHSAEAIRILEGLAARWPDRPAFQRVLFDAYASAGRIDEMEAMVERIWQRGYRGPMVKLGQAVVALGRRQSARAIALLSEVRGVLSAVPEVAIYLGRAYGRLGLWREAKAAFAEAVELDGNEPQGWIGLARASLALREDAAAAVDAALRAVALQAGLPEGHYVLGLALARMGRLREAVVAMERCRALAPDYLPAIRRLAIFQRELGNRQAANELDMAGHALLLRRRIRAQGQAAIAGSGPA